MTTPDDRLRAILTPERAARLIEWGWCWDGEAGFTADDEALLADLYSLTGEPIPGVPDGQGVTRPLGVAVEDSIEDPFTGEATVRVAL